ncbi:MAG: serine hydrolase [Planctomycetota bacterium]|nr:MAG: serine hydrolase [Planctomycetota bacterium]
MHYASLVLITMSLSIAVGGTLMAVEEEAANVAPVAGYEDVAADLRRVIAAELEAKNLPAFSIALVDGDRTVWAEGFGFQDAERQKPATARTVYRVGSVSKLFTDIAVMQLVEQGKLDLDAPVGNYLADFEPHNPFDAPITLRRLMSHRAGLVRESPVGNYFDPTEPTLAATVASLNDTTIVYKPGTRTKYSNAGIAVVGQVVEKSQGVAFSKWIDDRILAPLAMRQSGFTLTPSVERDLAAAWMWTYDGRRFAAPKFALGTAPAGNLYSSVLDLAKFVRAIFNGGQGESGPLLKPETLAAMMQDRDAKNEARRFGIGFQLADFEGHRRVGHGGAVYGFSTQLEALPDAKLGVIAVASLDGANGLVKRITDHALRRMLAQRDKKERPKFATSGPVDAGRARAIAGRYRSGEGEKQIEIASVGEKLYLYRNGFRFELRALADGFVVDDVLAYGPEVKPTGEGAVTIDAVRYERLKDEIPADVPERWKGLTGEYGWDHNTLYILEDRGRLVALIEWFYYYPLAELGENEFAFPGEGLYHDEKLRFTRDAQGRATQVVAADVTFERREVGTRDGQTFQIKPVRPIDELRKEALAATPPAEQGPFREPDLVELVKLDPTIRLDVRYATTNNFTGAVFYKEGRAFMQRPAAEAVVRAHKRLNQLGLGLLIHDAYRPWHVTKMFWDATPAEMKDFVANPANGSRHNRGCAVDLTLCDLKTGEPIPMVAGYDEFSPRSFPEYPGGTSRQRWYREFLRRTMEAEGFAVYEFEWWHFDYRDWKHYPILNREFGEISPVK